jgi:hypothetical protein
VIPTELDSIIRVATKAVAQDDNTPESERMCCRHLLRLAIPLLEQARLEADLNAIRNAPDRDTAKRVRERLMLDAAAKRRSAADAEAAGYLLFEVWGPKQALGNYPSGTCRTGD